MPRPTIKQGEYLRLEQQARTAVNALAALARKLGWSSIAARSKDLEKVLAEDAYQVAITGKSRAGKSTLLNALVGRRIAPAQRVLTTAVATIIGPGQTDEATVFYKDGPATHLDGPITAEVLAPYADQKNNPQNRKQVTRIHVTLSNQVLELGVTYVDIPGFDDPRQPISDAAYSVLSHAHALVLVLDVSTFRDGGFTLDNQTVDVLRNFTKTSRPAFVVCNKVDRLNRTERKAAEPYVRELLAGFDLLEVLAAPPLLLSAEEANVARERGEPVPESYVAFADTLWDGLWKTESIGLRRLHAVFEQLRLAGEEVSSLIASRRAAAPERERIKSAISKCLSERDTLLQESSAAFNEARLACAARTKEARHRLATEVSAFVDHVDSAMSLPTVSATVDACRPQLESQCQAILDTATQHLDSRLASISSAATESIARLRKEAGGPALTEARLGDPARWRRALESPTLANDRRGFWRAAMGGAAFAAAGMFAGPAGWLGAAGAAVVGWVATQVYDLLTDQAESKRDLSEKALRALEAKLDGFANQAQQTLQAEDQRWQREIQRTIQPFTSDLSARLEELRELSAEELQIHDSMRKLTAEARVALGEILGEDEKPAAENP